MKLIALKFFCLFVSRTDSFLAQYEDLDMNEFGNTTSNWTSNWEHELYGNTTDLSFDSTTVEENWPRFINMTKFKSKRKMRIGNRIKLQCPASGEPEPTIEWTKNDIKIDREFGKVEYTKWGLKMNEFVPSDSGSYTCTVCIEFNCINFTTLVEVIGKI